MSGWVPDPTTATDDSKIERDDRAAWTPRPWAAVTLKALVIVVPLATSVVASVVVAGLMPPQATFGGQVLWWSGILATSALVLIGGEALARRVLPLVGLLRLSLLFPGKAPSRVGLARRSSRKELERLAEEVRTEGLGPDAEAAAIKLVHLVAALDAHDRRTRGHSERVRTYTDLLAHRMHLDHDDANKLRWAALLHDIGKLSIPTEILNKPGHLTPAEWDLIHEHPAAGDRMLGALREWLGPWALVVLEHHERWDGEGYPAGIAGHDISLGARLVAVADSYDVMTSIRSYQPQPRTPAGARRELVRCSGSQFDPGMVRAFLNISTRRLWWLLGPAAWLVQVPLVGRAAIAAWHRPGRRPTAPSLSHAMVSAIAVIALAPGFLPGSGAGSDAVAAAGRLRGRSASAERRTEGAARRPQCASRAAASSPSQAVADEPTSPESPTGATPGAGTEPASPPPGSMPRTETAATPGNHGPRTPTASESRPVRPTASASGPASKPLAGSSGGPSEPPLVSVPVVVTLPPHDQGQHHGYGHVISNGLGHEHHDANGDGIDDKAGDTTGSLPGRH